MRYRSFIFSIAVAATAAMAASCTELSVEMPEMREKGLYFNMSMRSAQDIDRESHVDHIDIFIFDGRTGEVVTIGGEPCCWHLGSGDLEDGGTSTGLLLKGRWQDSPMLSGTDYDVCAVANMHGYDDPSTSEVEQDLSWVSSASVLKGVIESDPEIFTDTGSSPKKIFTMYGEQTGWNPQNEEPDCVLPIVLDRLAARICLTLTVEDGAEGFLQDNEFSSMSVELRNYADAASVVPGSGYEPQLKNAEIGDFTLDGGMQVRLTAYSYPVSWENDVLGETMLYVNLPYVSAGGSVVGSNWYRIPVCPASDGSMIAGNTSYNISAKISRAGSQESQDPLELESVEFTVSPWYDMDIPVSDDNPSYLILNEYEVEMRGIESYGGLSFASSSPVSVSVEDVWFVDMDGKEQHLSASGQEAENISAVPDAGLNGAIAIHSNEPLNKTIRYISLKVTNAQGGSADVTVMQYPLEYITGIPGLYSYLESYTGAWPGFTSIEQTGSSVPAAIRDGLDGKIGDNVDMKSKFYLEEDDLIYRVDYSYGADEDYYRSAGSANNNRMYHLSITSTSGDYTLARPVMDSEDAEVVDPDDSQNNMLVSPSFMIASQLGNNSVMTWSMAQTLCKEYVEVGNSTDSNGARKVYDDWRLPTAAEIQIIMRYQEDEHVKGITMDNILQSELESGDDENQTYYWTAVKNVYMNTLEPDIVPGAVGNSYEARVRCVRNFEPDDPLE